MMALNQYLDFKGIPDPMDDSKGATKAMPQPVYNPQPFQPGNNNGMPPPNMGPGGGPGDGNVPQYHPSMNN
jgi:hypothetical protein